MKHLKFIFILVIGMSILSFTTAHKFFVSVTQVEYVKEKQSVQMISKLFIDDIEKLIRERFDESITLVEKNEPKEIDMYVERYLQDKLKISINEQPVAIKYLGREYEDDIMVCYLEIEGVSSIQSFKVENTIFFDFFEDQQNIVRTKINNKQKSFILIKENDKGVINFN